MITLLTTLQISSIFSMQIVIYRLYIHIPTLSIFCLMKCTDIHLLVCLVTVLQWHVLRDSRLCLPLACWWPGAPAWAGTKPWQLVGLPMLEVAVVGTGNPAQDALGLVTFVGNLVRGQPPALLLTRAFAWTDWRKGMWNIAYDLDNWKINCIQISFCGAFFCVFWFYSVRWRVFYFFFFCWKTQRLSKNTFRNSEYSETEDMRLLCIRIILSDWKVV